MPELRIALSTCPLTRPCPAAALPRLCPRARGPTTVLIPRRGLSALDAAGGPFWWPEADAALAQSLSNWVSPHVRVRELDLHVNDPAFAAAAVAALGGEPAA